MPQMIGLALFQLGATSLATWVVTSATAAFIINAALGVGLSLLANALRGRSPAIKPSDGQQEIKQPLSPRMKSFGTVRVSGVVWWLAAIDTFLYYGIAINHGRIAEIVARHVNQNTVDVDVDDLVTTPPYDGTTFLYHVHLGTATETAYAELLNDFGVPDVRGDGVASVLAIIENPATLAVWQESYSGPDSRPLIRLTINSSVVWDPRDSAQSRTDETTWEFSDNPVVCLLNYLIDADGYGMPWERIEDNIAEWMAAMNTCDEEVDLKNGGVSARYRLAMTYSLTDDPKEVVDRILASCDGKIWARRDGSVGVMVGEFTAPTVTIASRDVLSYGEMTRGQDPLFAVAGIRAQYMSPDHDYREHEAEPWPNGATVLALSEERTAALDLTMVPSHGQARRLMKRVYLRETANWRGTIVTNLAGLRAIDERFITVVIDELGINESFEVGRFALNPDGTIEMEIRSVGAEIDDWDAATEEGDIGAFGEFAFVSSASKLGTALNPLTEGGGALGQTIIVFGVASSLAATPAGYTLITSEGPTSGMAIGAWWKVLDGTEGSATFLGASGVLIAMVISGAPNPQTSDVHQQVTTTTPTTNVLNAINAPYMNFAFAADNQNEIDEEWLKLTTGGASDRSENAQLQSNGSNLSGLAKMMHYSSSETPDSVFVQMNDQGTNGLLSFILRAGG